MSWGAFDEILINLKLKNYLLALPVLYNFFKVELMYCFCFEAVI